VTDPSQVSLKSLFLQQSDNIEKQFQHFSEKFETRIGELEARLDARLQALSNAIADLRVKIAEYQVLAVRVDGLDATAVRIEKRHADDIQVVLRQVQDLSDEIGGTGVRLSETQATNAQCRALREANTNAIADLSLSGGRKIIQMVIIATVVTAILVSGVVSLIVFVATQ